MICLANVSFTTSDRNTSKAIRKKLSTGGWVVKNLEFRKFETMKDGKQRRWKATVSFKPKKR